MVNALIMRIFPWHFVQTRGSVSYTFRMKLRPAPLYSLKTGEGEAFVIYPTRAKLTAATPASTAIVAKTIT